MAVRKTEAVFIEIGKCSQLYSERSFIMRAQVLLRKFGLQARIAIAHDISSALALARYQRSQVDDLPIDALEEWGDPLGIDRGGNRTLLKMIEVLKNLGVNTLLQFKAIPVSTLPSRFGGIGLYCRQKLEEEAEIVWPYWKVPESFSERLEFLSSEFCFDLEPLLFKAKEALDRLFSRLRGRCLRAEKIRFAFELEKNSTVTSPLREWTFELITPQGSTFGFLPILKERLYSDLSRSPLASSVVALQGEVLTATPSGKSHQMSLDQAGEGSLPSDEAWGSFVGELREYLGQHRVFWAQTTEERLPEKSWIKTTQSDCSQVNLEGRYPLRPTRIFKVPLPVTVIEDRLVVKGKKFKSIRWSRVERLSLDWLEDQGARNYYRVDLEGGRAVWIFSDSQHHFFAHGYFE
jgi:hypothetical protein